MSAEQHDEAYDTDAATQEEFQDAEFFDDEPVEDPGEEELEYGQEEEEEGQDDEQQDEPEGQEEEQEEEEEFHDSSQELIEQEGVDEQTQEQEELPDEQQQNNGSELDYENELEEPTQQAPVEGEVDTQSIPEVIVTPTSPEPQDLPDIDADVDPQTAPPESDVVVVPQVAAPQPQILMQTQPPMFLQNQPQIQSYMQPQAALPQFATSVLNSLTVPPTVAYDTTAQDLSAVWSNVTAAVVGEHPAAQAARLPSPSRPRQPLPSPSRSPAPTSTTRNPPRRAQVQSASTSGETTQVVISRSPSQSTNRKPVPRPNRPPLSTSGPGVASSSASQPTPRTPVLSAQSPKRSSPPTPTLAAVSAPPRANRTSPPRSSPPRGRPVAGPSSPLLSPAAQPGILLPSVQPPPIEEHPEFEDIEAQSTPVERRGDNRSPPLPPPAHTKPPRPMPFPGTSYDANGLTPTPLASPMFPTPVSTSGYFQPAQQQPHMRRATYHGQPRSNRPPLDRRGQSDSNGVRQPPQRRASMHPSVPVGGIVDERTFRAQADTWVGPEGAETEMANVGNGGHARAISFMDEMGRERWDMRDTVGNGVGMMMGNGSGGMGNGYAMSMPNGGGFQNGYGNPEGSRSRTSALNLLKPFLKDGGDDGPEPPPGTVAFRMLPTMKNAKAALDKARVESKRTGWLLNIAIGIQVVLGALTTGIAAATSGRTTSVVTSILGGISTLAASYLAKARGSNQPERSSELARDLDNFVRDCNGFVLDRGEERGDHLNEHIEEYRKRFEVIMGHKGGQVGDGVEEKKNVRELLRSQRSNV